MSAATLQASLIGPDDERWAKALSTMRHDIYHLAAYVSFASRWQESGQPCAVVVQDDADATFFVPLILRPIGAQAEGGLRDAVSSAHYPGPLLHVPAGADVEGYGRRAVAEFADALRAAGIVSAFIRLHPLLSPAIDALRCAGTVVNHGASVSIDLTLSLEELWHLTRPNHRRDIRQAQRAGYVARIDETWSQLDAFADLYRETMDRLAANQRWQLSREYFLDFRTTLGDCTHLCVVERDGELAAGALLTEVDGIVEYHLAATSGRHIAASPSKLLIDFARQWAKERGNARFHLAGSLARGDRLHHFKLGFSRDEHPMLSWRVIADGAAYDALVARRDVQAGNHQEQVDSFFPAYRIPGTAPA
jgi:hypothetical protein